MRKSIRILMMVTPILALAGSLFIANGPTTQNANAQPPKENSKTTKETATAKSDYEGKIVPYLNQYCNTCHNSEKNSGGVSLDIYKNEAHAKKDRKMWDTVKAVVASGEMPPKKKTQPKKEETAEFLKFIDEKFLKVDCTLPKNPGRVTLRRLNKTEYNYTIRDLCAVSLSPADDFPADDVGYGFDNIGDVLSMQPVLFEKYLSAAELVLETALPSQEKIASQKQPFRAQSLQVVPRSAKIKEKSPSGRDIYKIELQTDGSAFIDKFNFVADGEYNFKIRAYGVKAGDEFPKMSLRINGVEINSVSVEADQAKRKEFDFKTKVERGEKRIAIAISNPHTDKDKKIRTLGLEFLEIEGPIGGAMPAAPESIKKILSARPTDPKNKKDRTDAARKVITTFGRKAYRRPLQSSEIDRLMKLFEAASSKDDSFERAMQIPLKAILVSPNFLFRVEDDPVAPATTRPLNDYELASRLSYFLWSSMPDDELLNLAEKGELKKPEVLKAQTLRMLKDWKTMGLTYNFAAQWLQMRDIYGVSPDVARFPNWKDEYKYFFIREMELYFEHIVKNNRPITDFLDSDYTFVNESLAKHYGITGEKFANKDEFKQVKLKDGRRGGIVTMAGLLTLTSHPTRTSPVKRGKWIYENILGLQAPPAAPDVPELPPVDKIKGTVRQQLELHRSNPSCAACHAKLDPLGFALENFDAIGSWRSEENKVKIDASGELPDGTKFNGPTEFRKILLEKKDQFRRALCEKTLTFALGRGLEYTDKCTVDDIAVKLKTQGNDQFSALILAVVESDAFQKRAGQRSE